MPIADLPDLGRRIRDQRKALALTQPEAAAMTGVSVALWSELEGGKRQNVSLGSVLRILHTLGLDLELVPRQRPAAPAPA